MTHDHCGVFAVISYDNIKSKISTSNEIFFRDMTKFCLDDFLLALNL